MEPAVVPAANPQHIALRAANTLLIDQASPEQRPCSRVRPSPDHRVDCYCVHGFVSLTLPSEVHDGGNTVAHSSMLAQPIAQIPAHSASAISRMIGSAQRSDSRFSECGRSKGRPDGKEW